MHKKYTTRSIQARLNTSHLCSQKQQEFFCNATKVILLCLIAFMKMYHDEVYAFYFGKIKAKTMKKNISADA